MGWQNLVRTVLTVPPVSPNEWAGGSELNSESRLLATEMGVCGALLNMVKKSSSTSMSRPSKALSAEDLVVNC